MDVCETVHVVRLRLSQSHLCVQHGTWNGFYTYSVWLQCVIPIFRHSELHPQPSCHVNNFTKSHAKNAVALRKNRITWTTLKVADIAKQHGIHKAGSLQPGPGSSWSGNLDQRTPSRSNFLHFHIVFRKCWPINRLMYPVVVLALHLLLFWISNAQISVLPSSSDSLPLISDIQLSNKFF